MAEMRATTIWRQISVGVRMRLGARQPVGDEVLGYLHFRVGPSRGHPIKVTIQLEPSDTYTVKLVQCPPQGEPVVLEGASDIYCDQLDELLVEWEGRHLVS